MLFCHDINVKICFFEMNCIIIIVIHRCDRKFYQQNLTSCRGGWLAIDNSDTNETSWRIFFIKNFNVQIFQYCTLLFFNYIPSAVSLDKFVEFFEDIEGCGNYFGYNFIFRWFQFYIFQFQFQSLVDEDLNNPSLSKELFEFVIVGHNININISNR